MPQAFYNAAEGTTRLATETGAGQWGSALAFACAQFDLECKVYMVRASYEQKPYRRMLMETWGASVVPSPVDDPDNPGSLGLAISDAVRRRRVARRHALLARFGAQPRAAAPDGHRARGEGAARSSRARTRPDVVIGSCGGGSNLGGIALPFMTDADVRLVAVEPSSCPTLTEGSFDYDFGDTAGMTPLLPMYTLGHDFVPPSIHAGGLRYHGDSPIISQPGEGRAHGGDRLPAGQDVRGRGAVRPRRGQGARRPRPATRSAP